MRGWKTVVAAFALTGLLGAVGCQKIPLSEFQTLRERACLCQNVECTDGVLNDLKALKQRGGAPEDQPKATEIVTEMVVCVKKLDPDYADKIRHAVQ